MTPSKQLTKELSSTPPTKPTTSPAMKRTDLPEELLEQIFECIAPTTSASHSDFRIIDNYLAVSLTSKHFRRIILPINTLDRSRLWEMVFLVQLGNKGAEEHWSCNMRRAIVARTFRHEEPWRSLIRDVMAPV
jgi:hypothetical protein